MPWLTVIAKPGRLRLGVGLAGEPGAARVWRGEDAARILDRSIEGWRDLGSFSAEGQRVIRRVFLAATALALAREGDRPDPGEDYDQRRRKTPVKPIAPARAQGDRAAPGRGPLPAGDG